MVKEKTEVSTIHELFEELDAFDPKWQERYATVGDAARDAGVMELYCDWTTTDEGRRYITGVLPVRDYRGEIRAQQEAEENSSLPFKLSNIGSVPRGV
jgi:hypothetical protein